ncbi:P-II family nitrogen regulator [Arthrobacter sp. UYCu712]|uniref:P-II family nitrogen regulator n=1 Tax=Arthrobacter sp. UYCu712 TaxID=3156340 RepID=UPI00339B712D
MRVSEAGAVSGIDVTEHAETAYELLMVGGSFHPGDPHRAAAAVLVTEDAREGVMAAVESAARTGHFGDGKIWTIGVRVAVRVRTGERGAAAIA